MRKIFNILILSMGLHFFNACSDNGNDFPKVVPYPVEEPQPEPEKPAAMEQYTVFNSGDDNVNSYRIPSMCTTKNGTLLAFAEARRDSWQDRSFTNVVVKRSTDNGKTWSKLQYLTSVPGGCNPGAFIQPCPVVDKQTGDIFVFVVLWKVQGDKNGTSNQAYLIKSVDDGVTWSDPREISGEIMTEKPYPGQTVNYQNVYGFGPGSGLQMQGGEHAGRLIVPCSQSYVGTNGKVKKSNVTVYSDDHGATWKAGEVSYWYAEYQIAESPAGVLVTNLRGSRKISGVSTPVRGSSVSQDGGITWSDWDPRGSLTYYEKLVTPAGGCQGSILSDGNSTIYYSGPAGIEETTEYDSRGRLLLYKGTTAASGITDWDDGQLLYEKAAGYSCLTALKDGRIAVLFEAGPKQGFEKLTERPAGWMRFDLIILPNK